MYPSELNDITILVIEDSTVCMALIKAFLAGTGALLEEASNGEDGLQKFNETKIDMVITDLRLPDVEGLYLLRKMKKTRPDIPVIIQTASTIDFSEADCREAGCDSYITKPYTREKFLGIVIESAGKKVSRSRNPSHINSGCPHLQSSLSNPSAEYY